MATTRLDAKEYKAYDEGRALALRESIASPSDFDVSALETLRASQRAGFAASSEAPPVFSRAMEATTLTKKRAKQAEVDALRTSVCDGAGCVNAVLIISAFLFPLFVVTWPFLIPLWCVFLGCGHIMKPAPEAPPGAYPVVHLGADGDSLRDPAANIKRVVVFLNPVGGGGRAVEIFDTIVAPILTAGGVEVKRVLSEYAGHVGVLCAELDASSVDAVVVVGGDGTFHEAINGLAKNAAGAWPLPIGLIPAGSGNSFLHDFGMCLEGGDPDESVRVAANAIVNGTVAPLDVLRVQHGDDAANDVLYSINVVGWSPDQCAASLNIDAWRKYLGTARYDVCSLWGVLKDVQGPLRIRVAGAVNGRNQLAAPTPTAAPAAMEMSAMEAGEDAMELYESQCLAMWANMTQHFGKGMRAMPDARLDDGLMDIGSIGMTRGENIRAFLNVKTGAAIHLIDSLQCRKAEMLMPESPGIFNVDGEVVKYTRDDILLEVVPKAYRMLVPPPRAAPCKGLQRHPVGSEATEAAAAAPVAAAPGAAAPAGAAPGAAEEVAASPASVAPALAAEEVAEESDAPATPAKADAAPAPALLTPGLLKEVQGVMTPATTAMAAAHLESVEDAEVEAEAEAAPKVEAEVEAETAVDAAAVEEGAAAVEVPAE